MESETSNGVVIENGEDAYSHKTKQNYMEEQDVTLYSVFNSFISSAFFPNPDSSYASMPFVQRIKAALSVNVPLLREASRNTGHNVLLWTRRGSPLRALLVVSGVIGRKQ
ncbi:unnamed protein product [Ilex paraguariensis]|uniref:Uncharacterized protein n=1 Tax=Ilex paraguariensis TaxID=185542 RepID=A0ABC8U0I3_9AQUA